MTAGVYFLFLKNDDSRCKIGNSKNCVSRLTKHKATHPNVYMYKIMKTPDHAELAQELCEIYEDLLMKGGWYELSKDEVHDIVIDYNYEGDTVCTLIKEEDTASVGLQRVITTTTTETKREVICPKCGLVLLHQKYLDRHNKDFPECEDVCDTNFYPHYRKGKLLRDLDNSCAYCEKAFSSEEELTIHIGVCKGKKIDGVIAQNKMLESKVDLLTAQLSILIQKIN